MDSFRLA